MFEITSQAVDFSWRKDCITMVEGLEEAFTDSRTNGSVSL
jgi:hypothetical protein